MLETVDVEARLEMVLAWTKETLAELELNEQIRTDVTDGMEKQQREFLLRQQLAAIRKELGDDGEDDDAGRRGTGARAEEPGVPEEVRERHRAGDRPARAHRPSRAWSTAGSAPGSTPSPSCPGASRADDHLDLAEARPCSTPTTRASTT